MLALVLALCARTAFSAYHAVTGPQRESPTVSTAEQDANNKEARLVAFSSGYPRVVRENVAIYWNDLFVQGFLWFGLPQIFARFLLGLYAGKRRLEQRARIPAVYATGPALARRSCRHWKRHRACTPVAGARTRPGVVRILVGGRNHSAGGGGHPCTIRGVCVLRVSAVLQQRPLAYSSVAVGTGRAYGAHELSHPKRAVPPALHRGRTSSARQCRADHVSGTSVAIFLPQMAVSGWWLQRYRFGPAEWVWRTLMYGKVQPM